jgi:hypothetical protein
MDFIFEDSFNCKRNHIPCHCAPTAGRLAGGGRGATGLSFAKKVYAAGQGDVRPESAA